MLTKILKALEIGTAILGGMVLGAIPGAVIGGFLPTPASHLNPVTGMVLSPFDSGMTPEGLMVGAIVGGIIVGLEFRSRAKIKIQDLAQRTHSVEIEATDSGGYRVIE